MNPTDAELDAATEAYVAARWPGETDWRNSWPQGWSETRKRIRAALRAAADVRVIAEAQERERCAKIAEGEQYPGDIPADSHDGAYNRACVDIAMVIRGQAEPNERSA